MTRALMLGDVFEGPGRWKAVMASDGSRSAIISCPDCGGVSDLGDGHTINDDGTIQPSLIHDVDDCSFHEYVLLQGWDQ